MMAGFLLERKDMVMTVEMYEQVVHRSIRKAESFFRQLNGLPLSEKTPAEKLILS
jgi:hypothetical protein